MNGHGETRESRHTASRPTVTGLLPTWNRREYLSRAIDSMLSQSLPLDEILVIDDGSTDGTAAFLAERYGAAIRVISQTNTGVGGALARGVEEARSEWIAILNSDDRWTPGRNERLVRAASQVPEDVAWIFADTRVVTDEGAGEHSLFQQHSFILEAEPQIIDDPIRTQYPLQLSFLQSSMIRSSVLRKLGCFREHLRSSEDVLAGFQVACSYRFAACAFVATELYRTADLRDSSLELANRESEDYFRARIAAFSLAHRWSIPGSWAAKHAEVVRGLCKLRLLEGKSARRLAFEQFRCGFQTKSIVFLAATLLGKPGYDAWRWLAAHLRTPDHGRVLWQELQHGEHGGVRR